MFIAWIHNRMHTTDEMILALVLFLVLSQNDSNFTENADMALMVDFCLLEFVLQMGLHFVL